MRKKCVGVKTRKQLLQKQDNKCFYCGNEFGVHYYKDGKVKILTSHGDHQIPYAYLQSNPLENYVMACSICNSWKHSKMFDNIDECKKYLFLKWKKALAKGSIELLV